MSHLSKGGHRWWISRPRPASRAQGDYTSRQTPSSAGGHHYTADVAVNGRKLTAVIDNGAAHSVISKGLCDLAGLSVEKLDGVTFIGADGSSSAFVGKLVNPTIALSDEFEVQLAYVYVTASPSHLFLLGNDLLRNHSTHKYRGIKNLEGQAYLKLFDVPRCIEVRVPCKEVPSAGG